MKKLVNDVHAVVRETLEGFALAHPRHRRCSLLARFRHPRRS